jgi:co-chaperonin GroES (HSP10)
MTLTHLRPMPGWALCRTSPHSLTTKSGLILPTEIDKNVRSEGVAIIEAVCPKRGAPAGVEVGDQVLYRGFLRFANQVGELLGGKRDCERFLINLDDILAIVSGPGTIGVNGEYEVT